MISRNVAICVLGALLIAGCNQPGRALVKSDKAGLERMTDAPMGAIYALYGDMEQHPEISAMLKKGEKLGFVSENSKRYAIAGEKKVEINADKQYVWKLQDE